MAEGGSEGQEKTEEPTEKRKKEAREEGQVLSSKELFVFATLFAGTGLFVASKSLMPDIASRWQGYFNFGPAEPLRDQVLANLGQAFWDVLALAMLISVPLLITVFATQMFLGGVNISVKAMAFKPSRINPLPGIARMVSSKALVELSKAILKVGGLGAVAVLVVWDMLPVLDKISSGALGSGIGMLAAAITRLLIWLTLGLAVIAAIDVTWQQHSLKQKLMMSLQDLKDEHKQSEGSPEVKGRIRRLQMEAAQRGAGQRAAVENVAEATTIITNPTHFAVALKYTPGQPGAPSIVAMGRGALALEIIERGRAAAISLTQSPPLARSLYYTGDIGAEIPVRLFTAVATILAYVHRIDRGEIVEQPEVEIPDDLRFDEFGKMDKKG